MDSYEVMHTLAQLQSNYTGYTYFQAVVDAGATLGYKGTTFSPTSAPITINVAVSSPKDVVGTSGSVVFLGRKRPEQYHIGPAGQNGVNSDGTWSIK